MQVFPKQPFFWPDRSQLYPCMGTWPSLCTSSLVRNQWHPMESHPCEHNPLKLLKVKKNIIDGLDPMLVESLWVPIYKEQKAMICRLWCQCHLAVSECGMERVPAGKSGTFAAFLLPSELCRNQILFLSSVWSSLRYNAPLQSAASNF